MKIFFSCLLSLLPFYAMSTSITGIRADGETKVFSLDEVVSIKVENESALQIRDRSGDVDGGFSVIKFSDVLLQASDIKSNPGIKVYPNPVKRVLYLVGADAETKFEVLSTFGKVVINGHGESVDVSALASGNYVIVAGDKSVKFIKK